MWMLTWIAVLSALGVVALAARWWCMRVDSLGRPNPKPWISGTLLVLVSLTTGAFAFRHHLEEARLSRVASTLVGHHVRVKCESYSGTFVDAEAEPGYVRFTADGRPEAATTIKPDVCRTLAKYMSSSKHRPSFDQVVAVHIITHESMHMRGQRDEAAAECAALQRDALTARLMGANAAEAAALARAYWTTAYPRMPDEYRSSSCAADGVMDEKLADAPWSESS
jgi:hypothetical protein